MLLLYNSLKEGVIMIKHFVESPYGGYFISDLDLEDLLDVPFDEEMPWVCFSYDDSDKEKMFEEYYKYLLNRFYKSKNDVLYDVDVNTPLEEEKNIIEQEFDIVREILNELVEDKDITRELRLKLMYALKAKYKESINFIYTITNEELNEYYECRKYGILNVIPEFLNAKEYINSKLDLNISIESFVDFIKEAVNTKKMQIALDKKRPRSGYRFSLDDKATLLFYISSNDELLELYKSLHPKVRRRD